MTRTAMNFKFELDSKCFVNIVKKNKVEKLENKFLLVTHPFPLIEGEMLVFKPLKDD